MDYQACVDAGNACIQIWAIDSPIMAAIFNITAIVMLARAIMHWVGSFIPG